MHGRRLADVEGEAAAPRRPRRPDLVLSASISASARASASGPTADTRPDIPWQLGGRCHATQWLSAAAAAAALCRLTAAGAACSAGHEHEDQLCARSCGPDCQVTRSVAEVPTLELSRTCRRACGSAFSAILQHAITGHDAAEPELQHAMVAGCAVVLSFDMRQQPALWPASRKQRG